MSVQDNAILYNENYIAVQHDWQRSLKSVKDQFFINIKKYGEKTATVDVKCVNGKMNLDTDSIVKLNSYENVLNLEYNGVKKTFIAPYAEFNNIHKSKIYSADISPSENMIVSSDANAQLFVSDAKFGKTLRDLEGHIYDVYKCRFFPSGMVVLSGGMDMTVRIFSVEDAWNARTMKGHKACINDLGIIGEGVEVASCSGDGTLKVWNCGSGSNMHDLHPEIGQLHSLAISDNDLNMIGTGGESKKAVIYDTRNNQKIFNFEVDSSCSAVTLDSAMNFYVGTNEGFLWCFDLRSGKCPSIIKTERGPIHRLINNGVIGLITAFHDGTVAAYSRQLENGNSHIELTGADYDPIYDLSIAGNTLITACRDKTIRKYLLENI